MLYEGRDRHTWSLSSGPYRLASEPKLASAESDGENPAGSHMEVKFKTPYGVSTRAVLLGLRRPAETQQDSSSRLTRK